MGLGAGATGRLVAWLAFDPEMWSEAWEGREGGPLAIIASLVVHWFDVLTSRGPWVESGPGLVGAISGVLLLVRTRWCLARVRGWMPR